LSRRLTSFLLRTAVVLLAMLCSRGAGAQTLARLSDLPDAPVPVGQAVVASQPQAEVQGTAQVTGVVLDVQGSPVPQASVTLAGAGILGDRTTTAEGDGSFLFTSIPPGQYRLLVTAQGLDAYTSGEFTLKPGETLAAPKIALKISTTTSIDVIASTEQIAEAEVHVEEKQRVFGVLPNFYTSYVWDAAPMTSKQKFRLSARALLDPAAFGVVALIAGIEQASNTYPSYGNGIEGYGKRYGAAFADATVGRFVGSAILPSVLHQDPRYFYQGSGGFKARFRHAMGAVAVCRGDNSKRQPNYSRLFASLAAGAIANAYHPAADRGIGLMLTTFALTTAGNGGDNFLREFVLRGLIPAVPAYAKGRAQTVP